MVIVLPLGTLVAQRLGNPAAFATPSNSNASNAAGGGGGSRVPFLNNWHTNARTGTVLSSGVTSHIVSNGSREKAHHDNDADVERGVRVDREIEHREERISGGS